MPGDARASGNPRQGKIAAKAHDKEHLERALRGHLRLRALSRPQRHRRAEVFPQSIQGGAARALSRPARGSGQAVEVFHGRYQGACTVAAVSSRLPGHRAPHRDAPCALVCRARRSQMVRTRGDRFGDQRHTRTAGPALPARRQGLAGGVQGSAHGSGERGEGRQEASEVTVSWRQTPARSRPRTKNAKTTPCTVAEDSEIKGLTTAASVCGFYEAI